MASFASMSNGQQNVIRHSKVHMVTIAAAVDDSLQEQACAKCDDTDTTTLMHTDTGTALNILTRYQCSRSSSQVLYILVSARETTNMPVNCLFN